MDIPLVLCEDEAGSVQATLVAAGVEMAVTQGEGQPHRKSKMPRWTRERWEQIAGPSAAAGVMVTCCLFWTWPLPSDVARELYAQIRYHPMLERAAREAAAPLGDSYAAMREQRARQLDRSVRAHILAWATQAACRIPAAMSSTLSIARLTSARLSHLSALHYVQTCVEATRRRWTRLTRASSASR